LQAAAIRPGSYSTTVLSDREAVLLYQKCNCSAGCERESFVYFQYHTKSKSRMVTDNFNTIRRYKYTIRAKIRAVLFLKMYIQQ